MFIVFLCFLSLLAYTLSSQSCLNPSFLYLILMLLASIARFKILELFFPIINAAQEDLVASGSFISITSKISQN